MAKNAQPRPVIVRQLIFLQFFLSLGALGGGGVLLAAPDGHLIKMPLSMLKYSPFPNFLIPAAILFVFLGIYPLAVAYSLWKRPTWRWPEFLNPFKGTHWSWAGSLAAGAILIIWITAEVLWLRSIGFLHILYFFWGIVVVLATLAPGVRRYYAVNRL
jgi:hypothetical protein